MFWKLYNFDAEQRFVSLYDSFFLYQCFAAWHGEKIQVQNNSEEENFKSGV